MSRPSPRHASSTPAEDEHLATRGEPAGRLRSARREPLLLIAALASAGAGIIHGAVVPEHTDWWANIAFFVGLAVFQISWAAFVLVRKPASLILLLGAGANLMAFAAWLVSRTTGMPFGPHQGVAEPAARADIMASTLGVVVAFAALAVARGWRLQPLAGIRPALSAGAAGLSISALSLVGLSGVSGHAHSPNEDHGGHATTIQAASATGQLTPSTTVAQCRMTAQVASDAAFAKAAVAAKGNPAAIEKAEKAARKVLKRALSACESAPAPAQLEPAAETPPHPDDGHAH